VLQHDNNSCVGGCGSEETTGHLFLGWATFVGVWPFVLQWLGVTFVASDVIRDYLLQFGHIAGLP